MRKYKGHTFCGLNLTGYNVSFFQETKSWPSLFQRGKHMEEYTTREFIFILLQTFFEAEQHLTKRILNLNIP